MDRVVLREKFAKRLVDFRLEDFDLDVKLRALSALERAKIVDRHRQLGKLSDSSNNELETVTIETQCYIVSRGLVDEHGKPIYKDDEKQALADEIPAKALDRISEKILEISGMSAKGGDAGKNPEPTSSTPSEPSSSDSQQGSEGGTSTNS